MFEKLSRTAVLSLPGCADETRPGAARDAEGPPATVPGGPPVRRCVTSRICSARGSESCNGTRAERHTQLYGRCQHRRHVDRSRDATIGSMRHQRFGVGSVIAMAIFIGGSLLATPVAQADGGPHRFEWSNYNVVTGQTETFEIGAKAGCAMYHILPGWSDWVSLGGCLRPGYGFDLGRNADNRYELFAIGYDNQVWHNWQTRPGLGPWSGWYPFDGYVLNGLGSASAPGGPTVDSSGGRLTVTVIGTNNRYWARQQQCANGCWGAWHQV